MRSGLPTVDLLLGRADAVFIDVTDLREHVVWEIQRAQGLGAATRTLYLIDASADMDQTTARLASLLPNQVDRAHVFAYDSHGLRERDRFRSLLVDTLTSADRPRPADRSMTMSVIATILFVITVIPLIILLRPLLDVPLGMPEQLRLAHWPEVVDPCGQGDDRAWTVDAPVVGDRGARERSDSVSSRRADPVAAGRRCRTAPVLSR